MKMGLAFRKSKMRSRGMTLVELLIAMIVLLVGIWTIAAGFPKLVQSIQSEEQKTEMARFAERNMQRLHSEQGVLPQAITGGPTINPFSEPEDLSNPGRSPNAMENVRRVVGESFRIPGAQPTTDGRRSYSPYVLKQGPAMWEEGGVQTTHVYIRVPLTEQRLDPRVTGNPMLPNSYYVDRADGEIVVPDTVTTTDGRLQTAWDLVEDVGGTDTVTAELLVNYAWAEEAAASRPPIHYVQDERAVVADHTSDSGLVVFSVRAANLTSGGHIFDRIVGGKTSVNALIYFQREEWDDDDGLPDGRGRYVQEQDYGVLLKFHPEDAGLQAYVDYHLRTVYDTNGPETGVDEGLRRDRRKLLMVEDHVINSETTRTNADGDPFTDVKLLGGNINTEEPTFEYQLESDDGGTHERLADLSLGDTHVLAVDLTTGERYADWLNLQLVNTDLEPPLEKGYKDGVVCLPIGSGYDYVGHTMRFYYSTLDHHNIQVQTPPRTMVDLPTAIAYTADFSPNGVDYSDVVNYRTYEVTREISPITDMDRIRLEFKGLVDTELVEAVNSRGFTLSVDYIWYDIDDNPHFVYGEMHKVPPETSRITLENLSYHRSDTSISAEILAVRGVSSRSIVWWQGGGGDLRNVALDSYTLQNPLSIVQRAR
ncbi:MAG: prepilin-type N-terminal cleavage/methylation domain-containing protein [Armatimonadota bacterium]